MSAGMSAALGALARLSGRAETRCRICAGSGKAYNFRTGANEGCGFCGGSGKCDYPVSNFGTWVGNAVKGSGGLAERLAEGLREGPAFPPPGLSHESAAVVEREYVGLYVPAEHLAGRESGTWPEKGSRA